MESSSDNLQEDQEIRIVLDKFAQCQACRNWVRVRPDDNGHGVMTGKREIPLIHIHASEFEFLGAYVNWICDFCYQDAQEKEGKTIMPN